MVIGVSGHLVSSAFLHRRLRNDAGANRVEFARQLAGWRGRAGGLGPAASLRGMIERGAGPLCLLLGFREVTDIHHDRGNAAATLVGDRPVAAVVTTWGESLDGCWRAAVI